MKERTRLQWVGEFSVFLSACLAGFCSVPALWSVFGLSVLLLSVSDRGQHGALVEQARFVSRHWIMLVSLGSHLVLNSIALTASYAVGWIVKTMLAVVP